jgi:hypothetical protein
VAGPSSGPQSKIDFCPGCGGALKGVTSRNKKPPESHRYECQDCHRTFEINDLRADCVYCGKPATAWENGGAVCDDDAGSSAVPLGPIVDLSNVPLGRRWTHPECIVETARNGERIWQPSTRRT